MQYNEEYKNTTISIPKALITRVKVLTIEQGTTIKDVITKLLIRWVAEQERREER